MINVINFVIFSMGSPAVDNFIQNVLLEYVLYASLRFRRCFR